MACGQRSTWSGSRSLETMKKRGAPQVFIKKYTENLGFSAFFVGAQDNKILSLILVTPVFFLGMAGVGVNLR
jgi:hypothetical protein